MYTSMPFRQRAGSSALLGGRLIETVGDGGPRLMIEHDRTRLIDLRLFILRHMKRQNIILMVAVLMLLSACSGQYKGMPRAEVLAYQTQSTYGGLYELALAYGEAINAAVKEDTLHPGMYADYGVALALMGHKGTACRMLNAEVRTFPESRNMVNRIKQRLMPDMMNDTLAPLRDTANLSQLMGWAYDSVSALRRLPEVAPVIDSTDTVWIRKQTPVDSVVQEVRLSANQKRELLAKQQMEAEMARKAHADSVAAAKQAKLDAHKQAQLDKEKAKKQKVKDKKSADKRKKQLEKQKQKERKQQAAERQKQKEQQAAERKKQKEMEAAERQKQKAIEAAERQKQKDLEAAERQRQREQQAAERKQQQEAQRAARQQKGGEK